MAENLNSPLDGIGSCNSNVVPENQRPGRRYYNEDRLSPRPRRESLREQIADYVLLLLGAPVVDVELDRQQLSLCVDESLRLFEEYAPSSCYEYFYFTTVPGQSKYKMPPDVGLIRQVYWRTGTSPCDSTMGGGFIDGAFPLPHLQEAGASGFSGMSGYYGGFMGYNAPGPIYGMAGDWVIMKQYNEMYQKLTSQNGGWEWGPENDIILYPNPTNAESVIVHYLQRKKDWMEVFTWVQEYALCMAKEILGRIRSKYASVPGPNGGIQLDGGTLLQEAQQEKEKLRQELYDKYGQDHMFITTG